MRIALGDASFFKHELVRGEQFVSLAAKPAYRGAFCGEARRLNFAHVFCTCTGHSFSGLASERLVLKLFGLDQQQTSQKKSTESISQQLCGQVYLPTSPHVLSLDTWNISLKSN